MKLSYSLNCFGEPGGIRTPDPRLRRPMLYPTELLTHMKILLKISTLINITRFFVKVNENVLKI